jgi:hypothetical protein
VSSIDAHKGAERLLESLGAQEIAHPGGVLLSHLRRTRDLLAACGSDDATQLAGLCHAAYGTDGFPEALLTLDERPILAATIGTTAEAIVYRYASCDRRASYARLGTHPFVLTDRFTSETIELDVGSTGSFAAITIANELDVFEHATLTDGERLGIQELIAGLRVHAPAVAERALASIHRSTRRPGA